MTTTDLQAFLAAQRLGFQASLPGRLAELDAAWPAAPQEALQVAHRLAGSAGTFGFAALGTAAAVLEQALEAGADGPALAPLADALRRELLAAAPPADERKEQHP